MAIESSATSAANLEWYVRELVERGGHHDDPFGACNRRVAAVTPAADDPYLPSLPLRLAPGRFDARRLLRHRRLARRGPPAARAVRGRRLRAPAPYRRAARRRRPLRQRHALGRRRAQRGLAADVRRRARHPDHGRRAAPRPARSAPRSPPASAPACSPILRRACGHDPDGATLRARPAMAAHYGERYRTYGMLTEAMKPIWQRMAASAAEGLSDAAAWRRPRDVTTTSSSAAAPPAACWPTG